ncbi:MAG: flagellar basal body L-ring protein FlgH [Planctomycetes bacterium]|nr:flagellar basal body L-ring protein FlgH [Planctomycetota bacterium]
MNTPRVVAFATLVLVFSLTDLSSAGSIWAKRDKNLQSVYCDDVARGIGDVLTIKIAEESTVDNKAKRDLQKETARSSDFDGKLGIDRIRSGNNGKVDNILSTIPGFTMQAEGSNTLKGKADFKDERSFIDRVSVVVLDVLPNGNLVVLGTRDRNIAGDIQTIEVSGIVRPSDIAFDNTVKSEQVANFHIITRNSGVSASYTQPGWMGRIFDILWPW